MTLKTSVCALFALLLATATATADPYRTGLIDLEITQSDGGTRNTQGFLWYPTDQTTGAVPAHGNTVWETIDVIPKAPAAPGQHPLVLMSHGLFGNARNQAWLAQALTAQGYMVAAIDHPGTSSFMRDPDHRRSLWERPRDISRTLDQILELEGFGAAVDQERIFMAGHSLGGFTAVALAGGRFDPAKIDGFCASHPDELVCGLLTRWGIAKTAADREMMSADLSDARFAGFAVFDLGLTQSFSTASLAAIERPMLVIGAPFDLQGLDLDIESRALVAALPQEHLHYLEPATLSHFDFLGVCTDRGLEFLTESEPEDAFVCQNGITERQKDHELIVNSVLDFFADL
jgi:predicted dienelactone hydrolase